MLIGKNCNFYAFMYETNYCICDTIDPKNVIRSKHFQS